MVRQSMMLVLAFLAESGHAKSGEVAKSLGLKPKHASMVLSRCADRGFVSRRPYKSGRVRGYIYELSDKGAKWLLYKASQKTNDGYYYHRPLLEVGNKGIHLPKFKLLNLNQNQQSGNHFMLAEVTVPLWMIQVFITDYQLLEKRCDSLKQWLDLAILLLKKRSSERDFACYLYLVEHHEKLELLQNTRHEKAKAPPESFHKGWDQGFELGLRLGKRIGEVKQTVRTHAILNRVLLKKRSVRS